MSRDYSPFLIDLYNYGSRTIAGDAHGVMATEWSVAHCLSREETIRVIEEKVLELLQTIADERDPVMTLVSLTNIKPACLRTAGKSY